MSQTAHSQILVTLTAGCIHNRLSDRTDGQNVHWTKLYLYRELKSLSTQPIMPTVNLVAADREGVHRQIRHDHPWPEDLCVKAASSLAPS